MVPIMKLGPTLFSSTLLLSTACFEDPPPVVESGDSGGSTTGSTGGPSTDPTVDPSTGTTPGTSTTGPDETTTSVDDTTSADSTTTGEPPLRCIDGILEIPVGSGLVEDSTAPGGDDFTGTCGGGGSADLAYQWEAPFDGFFVFDTQGSDFDTVLYLRDDCMGEELACSDNIEGSVSSEIVAPFSMGDRVLVVVDGNAGETGNAVLNINPVECPSADLTDQPLPANFSNVAGTNEHGGGCGGDGNPERAFRYQAPADGLYAFRLDSDAFAPIAYLEQGPVCGGQELACNPPGFGRSEVMRTLTEGEYVTIWADSNGGAGDFDIDIQAIGGTCPQETLGFMPFMADINSYDNVMSTSCGPAGYQEGATYYPYADATFAWTSPGKVGANSGCDIIVTSGFPLALSLQAGTCDGPEVQCENGSFNMGTNMYEATVSVGHIPPTDFTVTVTPIAEPFGWFGGSGFSVELGCFAVG